MNTYSKSGILVALTAFFLPFITSRNLFSAATNTKVFFFVLAGSLLSLLFIYAVFVEGHKVSLKKRWLLGGIVGLLLIYMLSAFFGTNPGMSFMSDFLRSTGVLFLVYCGLFAFLLSELLSRNDWTLVRRSIAFSGGAFALLTFFGLEGLELSARFLTINFESGGLSIGNSTFAGAYLLLSLIVTLIEFTRSKEGALLQKTLGVAVALHLFSPLLFARGFWHTGITGLAGFIGEARASSATALLVVVFLLGWLLIQKYFSDATKRKAKKAWAVLFLVATLGAVALLFVPGSFVQDAYIQESTAARVIVWESGLEAFKERPILGWGPENFRLAHNTTFDNGLFLDENLGEIWFDRAHNTIVDTLVTVGIVGFLASISVGIYFVVVVMRARKRELIGETEAVLLSLLPVAHFLQLQTAFDTVITYTLLSFLFGYALWLEKETVSRESTTPSVLAGKVLAGVVLALIVVGGWIYVGEYKRQKALYLVFVTENRERQHMLIEEALGGSVSFERIRTGSASLIKGTLNTVTEVSEEQRGVIVSDALAQMALYERHWEEYIERVPHDYRARMNYAYLLIMKTIFGENSLDRAKEITATSYAFAPENPLTYALDALVELYRGNLDESQRIIDEGVALNPDIEFTKNVAKHIERQRAEFPNITVLRLENL